MDLIVKEERVKNKKGLVSVPANMSSIMSSIINVIICCPDM